MNKLIALLFIGCISQKLISQNGIYFEYKLTSSTGNAGNVKIDFSDFGSELTFSMSLPKAMGKAIITKTLIQKKSPNVFYLMNDANRTYAEIKSDNNKKDNATYTVKKIGEEKIGTYNCVHAIVTSNNETHEVWNTKDVVEYKKYEATFESNKRISNKKRDDALKAAGCDGLPVKMFHKGNDREGDFTIELIKSEKKNYAEKEFDIPKTYRKEGNALNGEEMKSHQDVLKMTPEERAKYMEEMKKAAGK